MTQRELFPTAPEWSSAQTIETKLGHVTLRSVLVQHAAELEDMRSRLTRSPEVAYDTETSGLVPALGARIIGHAFAAWTAVNEISSWYVPVRHIGEHNSEYPQLAPDVVASVVREILQAPGAMVGHHVKFDMKMAKADDVDITREIIDTSIAATIWDENVRSFSLKSLATAHIVDSAKDEEKEMGDWLRKDARQLGFAYKKRKRAEGLDELGEQTYLERFGYARSPIHMCGRYAIRDVFFTLLLWRKFAPVKERYPQLWAREHGISRLLFGMEWHGLQADEACIRDTHTRTGNAVRYWLSEVRRLIGNAEFTGSSEELRELLFRTLGLDPAKYTKGKQPSVDRESRKLMAAKHPQHAEVFRALDQLAQVEKLHSTYAGTYLKFYSPATQSIHPNYNQLEQRDAGGVPVTGRLSSSDPNNQNVASKTIHLWNCGCKECVVGTKKSTPKPENAGNAENTVSIRRYFTVPKGYVRVYIDFSQIELRVLAWLCQDPTLVRAFAEGIDLHKLIAEELGITRDIAKQVNFGNSYGMTEIGLATRLPGYFEDPEGTREKAKAILEAYFKRYVRILRFRDEFANEMRRNGCSFVNIFGRPRRIADIDATERWKYERAARQMMSSVVSGTAADLMKESMLRCTGPGGVVEKLGVDCRQVQAIHDEGAFDLKMDPGWTRVLIALKNAMEDWPMFSEPSPGKKGVPIKTNVAISTTTWEEKREVVVHPDGTMAWAA